jgi:hypothetical protein
MRLAKEEARIGKKRNVYSFSRDHHEGLGIGGRIILKQFLKKYDGRVWTGFV